jgi:NADH-quinone oxidoreductase subunit C
MVDHKMTVMISPLEVKGELDRHFPGAVLDISGNALLVESERLFTAADHLKNTPALAFDYLNYVTAVDYYDYFELVYRVTSLSHNHSLEFRVRCYNRTDPSVPSVTGVWRGADFQEREIFDLFGIKFTGHPNLKHIVLWEGFQGYPLRKDYL